MAMLGTKCPGSQFSTGRSHGPVLNWPPYKVWDLDRLRISPRLDLPRPCCRRPPSRRDRCRRRPRPPPPHPARALLNRRRRVPPATPSSRSSSSTAGPPRHHRRCSPSVTAATAFELPARRRRPSPPRAHLPLQRASARCHLRRAETGRRLPSPTPRRPRHPRPPPRPRGPQPPTHAPSTASHAAALPHRAASAPSRPAASPRRCRGLT